MKTNTIVGIIIDLKKRLQLPFFNKIQFETRYYFHFEGPTQHQNPLLQEEEIDLRVLQMR